MITGPDPAALERAAHRAERERDVAGAHVERRSRSGRTARGRGETSSARSGSSSPGQVVDDDVAEVLEQLRRGGLAAAGQAGDDDDLLVRPRRRRQPASRRRGGGGAVAVRSPAPRPGPHLPLRRMKTIVQLEQDVHRDAEDDRADEVAARRATAAKIAIAEDRHPARGAQPRPTSRCPTRDRPNSRIGNSMIRPNTRNIVVTKSKYGPAARLRRRASSSVKLKQERDRERQDEVGDRRRRARRTAARAGSRAGRSAARAAVRPGATNAHSW